MSMSIASTFSTWSGVLSKIPHRSDGLWTNIKTLCSSVQMIYILSILQSLHQHNPIFTLQEDMHGVQILVILHQLLYSYYHRYLYG